MKRWISFLLMFALLIALLACGTERLVAPGNFYYCRAETAFGTDQGVIAAEERELWGVSDDIGAMLELYLRGPVNNTLLISPFPRDTTLVDWKQTQNTLRINLSEEFAALNGIDLTIACACISRTFLELTDVTTIRISAENALLDGKHSIIMTGSNLAYADDSLEQLRTDLTIYYTDAEHRYLIGQKISVNLAEEENILSYLVQQLKKAPSGVGLESPLPIGTRLLEVTVTGGLCTLNFSSEFESNAFSGSAAQRITLLSLVNTLTQLEDVEQVEFCVNGNLLADYRLLNLSKPLVFDESAIGPVRTGVNEFDATLYISNGSALYLAAVPVRIRQGTGLSQAELVMQYLLNYQNHNGFYSTIPADTKLNAVVISDGICTIDLSEKFIETPAHLALSVHSIVASICDLEGIEAVQITVNGQIPTGDYADYFDILSPQDDWFL